MISGIREVIRRSYEEFDVQTPEGKVAWTILMIPVCTVVYISAWIYGLIRGFVRGCKR